MCDHEWKYFKDGYVEQCVPVACIKCGTTGCVCDMKGPRPPKDKFFVDFITAQDLQTIRTLGQKEF